MNVVFINGAKLARFRRRTKVYAPCAWMGLRSRDGHASCGPPASVRATGDLVDAWQPAWQPMAWIKEEM